MAASCLLRQEPVPKNRRLVAKEYREQTRVSSVNCACKTYDVCNYNILQANNNGNDPDESGTKRRQIKTSRGDLFFFQARFLVFENIDLEHRKYGIVRIGSRI